MSETLRDPVRDAERVRAVNAALQLADLPHAMQLARAALDDGVIDPLLLNLRSFWLIQRGRNQEALTDLAKALSIAPDDIRIRNAYGTQLARVRRPTEAVSILRGVLAEQPDFAAAHFGLGLAYEMAGELDEARIHHERAAAITPEWSEPFAHLAHLAFRRSDWSEAERYASRALAAEPGKYGALSVMADVALEQGDLGRADMLLAQLSARPPSIPDEAAAASTTLGDLRDAQGRYAEAFAAYERANQILMQMASTEYGPPRATACDYSNWLGDYFGRQPGEKWSARRTAAGVPVEPRDGASGHVFLVGFPRSGTTLAEAVLASHPDICALDERDLLINPAHEFLLNAEGCEKLANLDADAIAERRAGYWGHVRELGVNVEGKVFVDKHPLSTAKLPLVAKLFPTARVLFAVRDPRDVVLSCFRRSFNLNPSTFEFLSLGRTARYYDSVMRLAVIYREKLGLEWQELRHEDLVADFEAEIRKVCQFIGVGWNDKMRDFAERARARTIRTPSATQVARGLYDESVHQWRNYRAQLEPVMPTLVPWIEHFKYDLR